MIYTYEADLTQKVYALTSTSFLYITMSGILNMTPMDIF